MTISSDARTPSASVHALSGSTPPGSAPVVQPFGVATASAGVAEMPETFAPLGTIVAGIVGRLRPAHPDAAVIDLAGRVERLVKREIDLILRVVSIEDAIMTAMPPRPEKAQGVLQIACERSVTDDGIRVTTIREPAGWAAKTAAKREAHEAALAAQERFEEEEGVRRGLPLLNKLRDRAVSRLERWGLQLAAMRPTTQGGLKAKAAALMAVVEDGVLPDDWRQRLAVSVGEDALRIICTEAEARAEQDRQADGYLLNLVARLGPARQLADEVGAATDAAYAVWRPVWEDKPAALWARPTDRRHGLPGPSSIEEDGRRWYDLGDIDVLCGLPPLDQRSAPDEAGEARRLEIIAAAEAWDAACKRVAETSGYAAACERSDPVLDAMMDLEDLIHGTPALTFAGLIAKARVVLESAERRGVDTVRLDTIREVARFAPPAPAPSSVRPAPLPTGFLAGRYPAGTSREVVETYRTFLDMELRYLNHEVYGCIEGWMHLWLDNPAGALHGPREPAASTRAAAVLSLLGLMPTEGVHGKAQADGLAHAAASAA